MIRSSRSFVVLTVIVGACACATEACSSGDGGGGGAVPDAAAPGDARADSSSGADSKAPALDAMATAHDGASDATVDSGTDTGAGSETGPGHDAAADVTLDAAADVAVADSADAAHDAVSDAVSDVSTDVAIDAFEAGAVPDASIDAGDGGSCSYTLSGATTGEGPCNVNFVSASGIGFLLAAPPGTHPLLAFTTYFDSATPQTGTFTVSDVTCSYGDVTVNPPNASPQYLEISGGSPCGGQGALAAQGTFTLTITDVGVMATTDGGTVWYHPHGTLSATAPGFPYDVNSPGSVDIEATF
jgi:hypothetical protein